MRNFLTLLSILGLAVVLSQSPLHAKNWCGNSDLVGEFGLFAEGSIILPDNTPITGPFGRIGIAVFDGNGNFSVTADSSYNGLIFKEPYSGTYTVKTNCTATVVAKLPPPINAPVTLTGVLSDDTNQMSFLLNDPPGSTITGFIRKMQVKWCGTSDVSGDYSFDLHGSYVAPSTTPGGFKRSGKLTADGVGNFSATTLASYNGLIAAENISGTITVSPNCSVTINYSLTTATATVKVSFRGTIVDKGKRVLLIVTDPGAAIVGEMRTQ